MRVLRYLWVLPFLVLLYVYGGEALGVFLGKTEHFELLAGLGFANGITTALVWLSVLIEVAIMGLVAWRPGSSLSLMAAAFWPWVPRFIAAFTGGEMEMMEMSMSLLASAAAMCVYMAHGNFHHIGGQYQAA